jgi:osmotically inducible lipoprotein OsmB
MKKVIIISVLALTLAGCQSGPNQMVGTGVGAVGGYGVARALGAGSRGSAIGAVAGAVIGSEVGRNMDYNQSHRVIVREQPVYVRQPVVQCRIFRQYDPYYNIYRNERVCRQY